MRLRDYKRGMATQDVPVVLQESDIQSSITPTTRLTGARGSIPSGITRCQQPPTICGRVLLKLNCIPGGFQSTEKTCFPSRRQARRQVFFQSVRDINSSRM